jgi:hypothetical protein
MVEGELLCPHPADPSALIFRRKKTGGFMVEGEE